MKESVEYTNKFIRSIFKPGGIYRSERIDVEDPEPYVFIVLSVEPAKSFDEDYDVYLLMFLWCSKGYFGKLEKLSFYSKSMLRDYRTRNEYLVAGPYDD